MTSFEEPRAACGMSPLPIDVVARPDYQVESSSGSRLERLRQYATTCKKASIYKEPPPPLEAVLPGQGYGGLGQ